MRTKKDWSYFEFEVGKYEPYFFASEEEKKMFIPYKPNTKKLEWFVFERDFNEKEIRPLNVFEGSHKFLVGLLQAKKKYKNDYLKFAQAVRDSLQYAYWSKCEWETIITSWPPYVDGEEIDRLSKEKDECIKERSVFYRTDVNLLIGYKIDVFTQVMLNWDRFIDYVWNNKHLITERKLGLVK